MHRIDDSIECSDSSERHDRHNAHHSSHAVSNPSEAIPYKVSSDQLRRFVPTLTMINRRIQLVGLFSIGILLIIIALVRLPVWGDRTAQIDRNTWGSVEVFFAAFVANVPTLFTLRHSSDWRKSYGYHSSSTRSKPGRVGEFLADNILVTRRFDLEHEMTPPGATRSGQSRISKQYRESNEDLIYQGPATRI